MINIASGLRLLAALGLSLAVIACSSPEQKKAQALEKAKAHAAAGKYAEAIIEYRNALKVDARFGEARLGLAEAYEKTGNRQAAREYIRAAELLPDLGSAQIRAASLLLSGKQYEEARKHADLALKVEPRSVEAQLLRAYALAGLKDAKGAIEELEKAMEFSPGDSRPHSSLGLVEAASGNRAEAEAAFKKAIETDPASAPAKLALAYFYWSGRRVPEAERVAMEVLKADPKNVEANRILAMLYLATQRPREAEAPLQRLVDMKDSRASLVLADLYLSTGRLDDARPLYASLKATDAGREVGVARLAGLEHRAGRTAEAHAAVDEHLKSNPKSARLLALKAQFYSAEGRRAEAVEAALKAAAADNQSSQAQYVLGFAQAENRNFEAAIAAYKEALRLNPSLTAAQLELSRLLLATEQTDQALQQAQAAQKASPLDPRARMTVARALLHGGDIRKAESEARLLVQQFPSSSSAHALLGRVLMARSDRKGAIEAFDRALALNPAEVEALTSRLAVDLSDKQPQAGRARLERALAKAPTNSSVLLTAARFEHSGGDSKTAEGHLRKAIEIEPENLDAYNLLARLYIQQRKLNEGKRELEEIVRRKPDAVAPRTMIGMIQQIQGQTDEAMKTYDAIINDTPKAPVAQNNLAYLYVERGQQLDLAVQLAQAAKQQMPDNPDVSDTLGWAYYKKGMPELAVKALEFSVQKNGKNPLYLVHLGLAYAKAGRPDKAKSMLNQALKLDANVEGAAEARAVLASLQS